MAIFENKTYPTFKPGQILTSADLASLQGFLEQEDRLARAALIGAGIFCGLEIRREGQSIRVSNGAGVSADGYLFAFESEQAFFFPEKEKVAASAAPQIISTTIGPITFEAPAENVFLLQNGALVQGPLPLNLDELVFVLFCNLAEKPRKKCFNGFDSAGVDGSLEAKLVGIERTEYEKHFWTAKGAAGQSAGLLEAFPCVGRVPICANFNEQSTYESLQKAWLESIAFSLESILAAIEKALGTAARAAFEAKIQGFVAAFFGQKLPFVAPFQYLHSHLREVACAFDELAEAQTDAAAHYCFGELSGDQIFLKYITLGTLDGRHRMPFFKAGEHDASEAAARFEVLKKRFEAIVADPLQFSALDAEQPVRFSAGGAASAALGEQAIPYYYMDALRDVWHPTRKAPRTALAQKYEARAGLFPRDAASKSIAKFDFFRVEGHLGLDLKSGFEAVKRLRDELGLPFSVTCVRLGPGFLPDQLPAEMVFAADQLAFHSFCRANPGLEHLGGVPRGGTLVLVFVDDFDFNNPQNFVPVFSPQSGLFSFLMPAEKAVRRIVADFCLPYMLTKSPFVQYEFQEICPPLADFEVKSLTWHAAFEAFFEAENMDKTNFANHILNKKPEARPPIAKLILNDRSDRAAVRKWFLNGKAATETDAFFVQINEDEKAEDNLVAFFDLSKIQKISIARTVEFPGLFPENRAEQTVDLCPHELNLTFFDDENALHLGQTIELLEQKKGEKLTIRFDPPGGRWTDTTDGRIGLKLDGEVKILTFEKAATDFVVGEFFIRYGYPVCGLERELRLVKKAENTPGVIEPAPERSAAGPSVAAINRRRARLRKAIENENQSPELRKTETYKQAELLVKTAFSAEKLAEMAAIFEKTAKGCLTSLGKTGGADDGEWVALLQNATWYWLDWLVAVSPEEVPELARKTLAAAAAAMRKKPLFGLAELRDGWRADELGRPVTRVYLSFFD